MIEYFKMTLWFEKYRPTGIDDIIISENKITFLNDWFDKFKRGEQESRALLFTGPPGLGKTTLAHVILNMQGYSVVEFNASDIRSKAHINEKLDGLINFTNVNSVVLGCNVKTAIIMDEVDGMFKGDRGGIDELLSFISVPSNRKKGINETNTKVPIICICNLGNIKRDTIKQLQKECCEIQFTLPDAGMMRRLLDRISTKEGLTITDNARDFIIEWSQADFRRMVGILEFLSIHACLPIDLSQVESFYTVLTNKEKDVYITDSIKRLLNDVLPIEDINSIYNADKSKAPMVVHQNYIKAIDKQRVGYREKIDNAIKTIDSLVVSDVIEKHMYNSQHWHLQTVQGLSCTYVPNYYINRFPKMAQANSTWASVLSISSQSQNLKKNMYEIISLINGKRSYSIDDVQHLIEIVLQSIMEGDYESAVKLIMNYTICDIQELKTKKVFPVIDKLLKFIKISPYCTKWERFREKTKNNKDIDTIIKEILNRQTTGGIKVTIKPKPMVQEQPVARRIVPTAAVPVVPVVPATEPSRSIEEQKAIQSTRKTVTIKKKPVVNI